MPWVKIPPAHHTVFRAALPKDPRVETVQMFGGIAAKVNGHMFAALFARSAMVVLSEADRTTALALDGAAPFDPMGRSTTGDKVQLPEDVFHDPDELQRWIGRAFAHTATRPRKIKAAGRASARPPAVAKPRPARPAVAGKPAKRATRRRQPR